MALRTKDPIEGTAVEKFYEEYRKKLSNVQLASTGSQFTLGLEEAGLLSFDYIRNEKGNMVPLSLVRDPFKTKLYEESLISSGAEYTEETDEMAIGLFSKMLNAKMSDAFIPFLVDNLFYTPIDGQVVSNEQANSIIRMLPEKQIRVIEFPFNSASVDSTEMANNC